MWRHETKQLNKAPWIVSAAWICLGLLATPAPAADLLGESSGSWGAHVGYARTRDAEDGNYLIGGHLELQPAPFLGLQGAIDYRSSESIRLSTQSDQGDLEVRTIPVTATARLYLPLVPGLSPFALAGAGWYRQTYDFSERLENLGLEDRSETTFGWHLGGGARLAVAPRLSLYGEARYIFLDPERKFGDEVQEDIRDIDYNSTYLLGGMNFHF
jgi:opacity protein-like surface antigen